MELDDSIDIKFPQVVSLLLVKVVGLFEFHDLFISEELTSTSLVLINHDHL